MVQGSRRLASFFEVVLGFLLGFGSGPQLSSQAGLCVRVLLSGFLLSTRNEPPMLFITEGNPSAHDTIRSKLDDVGIRNDIFNLTGGLHSEWNW